jgi:hypothetical protein
MFHVKHLAVSLWFHVKQAEGGVGMDDRASIAA